MFALCGPMPDQYCEAVRQIHAVAILDHDIKFYPGMVIHLYGKSRQYGSLISDWQIILKPADSYHGSQWFYEASGMGMLFSERNDGPNALKLFLDQLREAGRR